MTDAGGRGSISWVWVVLAVPAALVGLFVLLMLFTLGLRTGGGRGADDPEVSDEPAPEEPVGVTGASATVDAVVRVDAGGGRFSPPSRVTTAARTGDVVEVQGRSFLPHTTGVVAQCDGLWGRECRNVFPITTDGDGRVHVLYRVGPTASAETLVVEVDLDRAGALLDGRPAVVAALGPTGGVRVSGLAPGGYVTAALCDEHADRLADCRSTRAVGADGRGEALVDLPDVRRGESAVLLDASGTALVAPIEVTAPTPALDPDADEDLRVDLDAGRVTVGLLLALLLAVAAGLLVRTTDWRVPPEAEVEW